MKKSIRSQRDLQELLKRYIAAGVTDEMLDDDGTSSRWITAIQNCIKDHLAMDEIDYENTPKSLKPLWFGLK